MKWRARICVDGESKYIGLFPDEIAAARAYDAFIVTKKLDRPLNFPGQAAAAAAASMPAAKRRKKKKKKMVKKKKKKSTPAPSAVIVVQSDDEDMEPSSSDEDDDENDRGSDEEIQLLLNSTLRGAWLFGEAETNM